MSHLTFTDAELIEEGYDIFSKDDVVALIRKAGLEVLLMDAPIAEHNGANLRTHTWRFGLLSQVEANLKGLKERGVKTVGLWEVHRWAFDKLTKVRIAHQEGI